MTQILVRHDSQLALFGRVHGGFGGFDIVGGARFYFDKAQDMAIPADEVDLAALTWDPKVPRHHHVAEPPQEEVRVLFAAFADDLMRGDGAMLVLV